jgi:hypothetical protein
MSDAQSNLYQAIRNTATKTVLSYTQENCGSHLSALSATLTPTCKRYFRPSSFFAGSPEMASYGLSNAEYEARMAPEIAALETWRVDIKKIIVDEAERTAMVRSDNYLTLKGRKEVLLEFVFILDMDETGEKVDKVEQYMDTAECYKYLQMMEEVAKEQQAQ